jgi:acetyl-CoA C-acetyltransferase
MIFNDAVILGGLRTPFGKFGGAIKDVPSVDLGAFVIRSLCERFGIQSDVEEVFYGTSGPSEVALETGVPARQAVLRAGLPDATRSLTIDRACCSSMSAAALGAMHIEHWGARVTLAVGAENMSRRPYLIGGARWKTLGPGQLVDPCYGLGYKGFNATAADVGHVATEYGITREEQDEWAFTTQQRYDAALKAGKIADEIVPFIWSEDGASIVLEEDEFPKPWTSLEKLAALKPVYGSPSVTAGNAPGLDAGAAGLALSSRTWAEENGQTALASLEYAVSVALEPRLMAAGPAVAIRAILQEAELHLDDIDLIEINEAFAAVPLVSTFILSGKDRNRYRQLLDKVNVNGGAVAIGHPTGASGARIINSLALELRRRGGGRGIAAICGGLAQADAVIVKVE